MSKYNISNAFLFFYDWIEPFKDLPPEDFKELVLSMLEYQRYGTEPPQFNGIAKTISQFIFPQLERRREASQNGLKGVAKKRESAKGTSIDDILNELQG